MKDKNFKLKPLPSAFYTDQNVNVELLKHIFETVPKASSFSKVIAKLTKHEIPHTYVKRLCLISRNLPDPSFRRRWYEQTDSRKSQKNGWYSLYQLACTWICETPQGQELPNILTIDSERKQLLFFQNSEGAWFIRPTSIPAIMEIAFSNKIDPSTIALYLWAYSEAAVWYKYEPALFDVDIIDFTDPDQLHAAEYCSKVRELFQPVSFTVEQADVKEDTATSQSCSLEPDNMETEVIPTLSELNSNNDSKNIDSKVATNQQLQANDKTGSKYLLPLKERLIQIEDAWHEHLSKIDQLMSKITEFQSMPASAEKISSIETLVSAINVGLKSVLESMVSYSKLFEEKLNHLAHKTKDHEVLVTTTKLSNIKDINAWLSQKTNDLQIFTECEQTFARYHDCLTKLDTYGIPEKWDGPFTGLSSLIEWLNLTIETGERQCQKIEKIESFKSHCAEESLNLNWNPFSDEMLGHDGWMALCSPISKTIVMPYLIGLAFRKLLETEFTKYSSLINDVLNDSHKDFDQTCKILSMLSSNQIEQLWDNNAHLRPSLTMCTLNSWLIACDNTGSSSLDFWYLKPLKDASTKLDELNIHVDRSVNNFLHELKMFVRQSTTCSSSGSGIQRIITAPSKGVNSTKVWADQLYNQVKLRVMEQPTDDSSYECLEVKAYEQLFSPLKDAFVAHKVEVVHRKYDVIREQFDFEDWFVSNSGKIESHYITSEHKKKILLYIDERFDCLDKWLAAEFDTTSKQNVKIRHVQNAAVELLEQYEQRDSLTPDEYLLTIGWWVNELQRNATPPVTSAGNPIGDLDNSLVPKTLIIEHMFLWRCIEVQSEHSIPTWNKYFADVLSLWSNSDIQASVIQQWQEGNRIECLRTYLQHCERRSNIDLSNLIQWIEEQEVELKASLERDFKDIQSKLEGFQCEIKLIYLEELDDIRRCFDSKDWFGLKNSTHLLKEAVQSELENYGKDEKRQQLCDDISYLGGKICNENDLLELELQLEELLCAAEDRMVHITVLNKLLQLPELPENLQEELNNVVQLLNQPKYLPEADRAEWLKYILETVFTPLSENLAKPDILIPEYRELLVHLLFSFTQLLMNSEWLVVPNSETEQLLTQASDRLEKKNSIASIKSLQQFLEWFSTQCESYDIATFDSDWDSTTNNEYEVQENDISIQPATMDNDVSSDKARRVLINALKYFSGGTSDASINGGYGDEQIKAALNGLQWSEVTQLCVARVHSGKEEQYSDIFLLSAGVSLAHVLNSKDRTEVVEALLFLIDHANLEVVPNVLIRKSLQSKKNLLNTLAASWLFDKKLDDISSWHFNDIQTGLPAVRLARLLGKNGSDVSIKQKSNVLDSLWNYASGESWGANFRACLLSICVKGAILGALIFLLKKDPIKMKESRAILFAGLVERANNIPGWERLSGFLESERNKRRAKPFTLFAEQLLQLSHPHDEKPAMITIGGPVEKGDEKNLWIAVIDIIPSVMDPPQDIYLRLPSDSPVLFGSNKSTKHHIPGPILDRKQIRIELNIKDALRGRIPIEIQCNVKTLQDFRIEYMQTWVIETNQTDNNFVPLTPSFVEKCFNRFPHTPVRKDDFIPRDSDEKIIEDTLFSSERAGSLWITSPRRSGKTSMLFRILDEFSYVKGRDDIVLYFTMSSQFDSEKAFNTWIWKRILKGRENQKLKTVIPNLEEIGTVLDRDVDVDIFISELAEKLLKKLPSGARVYFVIDEIDRFAEMFLVGGLKKEKSLAIMWQLRHLISNDPDVGIVFSGSHAARRFFIADPSAPFYNSISAINLSPFDVETEQNESRTRDIVLPKNLADSFTVSKATLRHLLGITAGIPYYMKLLAGATFSCATHEQIFPADVNEGVSRMLAKETGIKTIDMLENPGEDELRTLYAESINEKALIKGVLLAVANIRSPVSGHPVNVGEIWSERSPLVVRTGLSKKLIEPALTSARDLGFLITAPSSDYQVEFAIPLLGESMRNRFNTLWAEIEHHLENMGDQ